MVQRTLSYSELDTIKKRYPHFELYYESMLHNNVPEKYNLAYAIPLGKKCIAWFTFYKDKNVLFIMEMNKEKKIVSCKASILKVSLFTKPDSLSHVIFFKYINSHTCTAEAQKVQYLRKK